VQQAVTLPRWPSEINAESVQVLADLATQDKLISQPPDLSKLLP
jgi:NitT/TauT family transport system substrate-binding protein